MLESALLAFTLAPQWTPAAVERAKGWMRRNGGEAVTVGALLVGALP